MKISCQKYLESYNILFRRKIFLVAQLRAGILPLADVGRFENIQGENRLRELCELGQVESEYHFLLYCTNDYDLRVNFP